MKAPTADQGLEDAGVASVVQLGPRIAAAKAARFLAGTLERVAWVKRVRVATESSGETCLVIEVRLPLDDCRRFLPTAVNSLRTVLVHVG